MSEPLVRRDLQSTNELMDGINIMTALRFNISDNVKTGLNALF